ncbi:amidase [Halobacillus litoralis]|uniref:amidase n=1 Tax=Halobacillus litoralis TaxID=45668 RepID=UPI001CD1EE15|nr:amidase [Halobacillus litoralis]MCA0971222.1 amidase [Halobacillus litoralis]
MEIAEIRNWDGTDLKQKLRNEELSLEEVLGHFRSVIERRNPELNAVVHKTYEEIAKADVNTPLAGLPFLIKDLNAMQGQPLSYGSKVMEGFVAPGDDVIVSRYKKAGLTILGKSNTPEFGFTPATESNYLGYTKNPWDVRYSPGGSSGGAAAAVATGMVPFAHGSDGGGSIRIPASNCGLFGLKPTRGRTPFSTRLNSFAASHAITRSVRDSAWLLDILEGPQTGDLFATPARGKPFSEVVQEEVRPLRIAYLADFQGLMEIDRDVQDAVESTAHLLESLGHSVEIAFPDFDLHRFMDAYVTVWVLGGALAVQEAAAANGRKVTTSTVGTMLSTLVEKGKSFSAMEYEEARNFLASESGKVHQFFDQYDILLHPVTMKKALPLGSYDGEKNTIDEILAVSAEYAHLTPITNATGQPSMSVPLYWNSENVPIGSHFTAPFGDEATLFQLAAQLEQARPWWSKYKEIE